MRTRTRRKKSVERIYVNKYRDYGDEDLAHPDKGSNGIRIVEVENEHELIRKVFHKYGAGRFFFNFLDYKTQWDIAWKGFIRESPEDGFLEYQATEENNLSNLGIEEKSSPDSNPNKIRKTAAA